MPGAHRAPISSRGDFPLRAPGGFPVVGIIGGGQLARMCAGPAAELGLTLSVLAEAPDASAALVIPSAPVGEHSDVEAVLAFARECDVVTFDHEQVPADVLAALSQAAASLMHPTPEALVFAQDKLAMRERLTALGIPCPRWASARTAADVDAFGDEVGWPVVAKTPRGGYDGKGVRVVGSAAELADWLERAAAEDSPLLLEEKVPFTRELAVLLARSPSGQAAAWPVVETVQTDSICTEVIAPAAELDPDLAARATEAGLRIAGELGVTGRPRRRALRAARWRVRRQRARDASAQQWPLVDGRRGHRPVRAAPARRPRPAAGLTETAPPLDGDGQHPRRRAPRALPGIPSCHGA